MHNIPIVLKLRLAIDRGETVRAQELLDRYDLVIHSSRIPSLVSPPVTQIELYELQIARLLSRQLRAHYFVQKTFEGDSLRRVLGFVGLDQHLCVERFSSLKDAIDDGYKRKYYGHKIKKGTAASEAYRAGFMEAVLDRCRSEVRDEEYYRSVFNQVKLRDIISNGRRDLRDQQARSAGLDDGLIAELTTLNLVHAKSLRCLEEPGFVGEPS